MATRAEQGDTVGAYVLDAYLGSGGFAEVWRARHVETGALVAIKLLTRAALDADAINLRAEIELLAGAAAQNTEHLVRVLDGGTTPVPFVVMELVRGSDLASELRRGGRLSQRETVRVGLAVAEALVALHSVGIIHRDVKPANVMLEATGTIKLADFGIAKIVGYDSLTMTGQGPFSPYYAAPEAWEGRATMQSDLYSLGAMLHECLAGVPPFVGTLVELLVAHREAEPDMTRLPEDTEPTLRALIHDCMEKEPSRRPATAAECLATLRGVQAALDVHDRLPVLREPLALGPWRIEGRVAGMPWAFHGIEPGGETAIVEVHGADDLSLGEALRTATEANPSLVPLGAERLLGTNRLILRPGEGWLDRPPLRFQFWVAREAPPVSGQPPLAWDRALLGRVAAALGALQEAGARRVLALDFREATVLADGSVRLARPGLPPRDGDPLDALGFLRGLALPPALAATTAEAPGIEALYGVVAAVEAHPFAATPAPPPMPVARGGDAGVAPVAAIPGAALTLPSPAWTASGSPAAAPVAPPVRPASERTDAAPPAVDPKPGASPQPVLTFAGAGQRLAAGALDALVPLIVFSVVAILLLAAFNDIPAEASAFIPSPTATFAALPVWLVPFAFVEEPRGGLFPWASDGEVAIALLSAWLAAGLGYFIYAAATESSTWQATPGKRLLGLQLATLDGSRPATGRVRRRALVKSVLLTLTLGLGTLVTAARYGPAFYDRATGIVVVRR